VLARFSTHVHFILSERSLDVNLACVRHRASRTTRPTSIVSGALEGDPRISIGRRVQMDRGVRKVCCRSPSICDSAHPPQMNERYSNACTAGSFTVLNVISHFSPMLSDQPVLGASVPDDWDAWIHPCSRHTNLAVVNKPCGGKVRLCR
jgi:hypothetical protein